MNEPKKPTRPIEVSLLAISYFASGLIGLVSFVSRIFRADSPLQQTPFTMDMLFALALVIGSIILAFIFFYSHHLVGIRRWPDHPLVGFMAVAARSCK